MNNNTTTKPTPITPVHQFTPYFPKDEAADRIIAMTPAERREAAIQANIFQQMLSKGNETK